MIPLQVRGQISWRAAGLQDSNITSLQVTRNGKMLACVDSRQLYLSADTGQSWMPIPSPALMILLCALDTAGTLYAGDPDAINAGLQRSTDSGAHWTVLADSGTIGCYSLGAGPDGTLFATFADGEGVLSKTLFRSTDRGTTWQRDSVGFGISFLNTNMSALYTFTGKDSVFVIGMDGLYRSIDNGVTWARQDSGLPVSVILSVTAGNGGNIFLSGNYIGHVGGVWRSTDEGESWNKCDTAGLPAFADFIQLASDSHDAVYGILEGTLADGVYRSSDGGHSWNIVPAGLPDAVSQNILVSGPGGTIFCGTRLGIYRSEETTTSVHGTNRFPSGVILFHNYPNPFNPSTLLSFTLPDRRRVKLQIFNMLGALTATLIDAETDPGSHTVRWSPGILPNGVYFYRFSAGAFSSTGKMVYLK